LLGVIYSIRKYKEQIPFVTSDPGKKDQKRCAWQEITFSL